MTKTEETIKTFETRVSGKGGPYFKHVGYLWKLKTSENNWNFIPHKVKNDFIDLKDVYERRDTD